MKISVVMPVTLQPYPGAAENREKDFIAAVKSFISQTHRDKELIIISDGDETVHDVLRKNFVNLRFINLVELPKQELFSGKIRQAGVDVADGELVCYLDSDDFIAPFHLSNIAACAEAMPDADWYYFNAFYKLKEFGNKITPFTVNLNTLQINTGCFAHKKNVNARWDVDINGNPNVGIGENVKFASQLIERHPKRKFIAGCGYFIQHYQVSKIEKAES